MQFKNRYYQDDAITAGLATDNGILVLPTGAGKSLVCAGLANGAKGDTLVLQPSKEILESNYAKAEAYGFDAAIYSASVGIKEVASTTYATIGSIINCLDKFSSVENIIIDECHLVNAKGGQYEKLIKALKPKNLWGMTATPYRLHSTSMGSNMRLINRTRPKIFKDIAYYINPSELLENNYLVLPEFIVSDVDKSMLKPNTTGAEFSEQSIKAFEKKNNLPGMALDTVGAAAGKHNHILTFVQSIAISDQLVSELQRSGISAASINAETKKNDRTEILKKFRSGEIKTVVNVGTLTTGYDFPALDCLVYARPTMSAALHYQIVGRVVRPYENKKAFVYDLAGNIPRLGNPLNYTLAKNSSGIFEVYGEGGRVTTRIIDQLPECETIVTFGKYSGKTVKDLPTGYLEWGSKELKGDWKHVFYGELKRRELFAGN